MADRWKIQDWLIIRRSLIPAWPSINELVQEQIEVLFVVIDPTSKIRYINIVILHSHKLGAYIDLVIDLG